LAKKKEIQKLIHSQRPDVICIQETKMEVVERSMCTWLWGSDEFGFTFKPAEGRSGGLLTIWNSNVLVSQKTSILNHTLWLEGEWGAEKKKVNLMTVYAPCDTRRKRLLWLELKNVLLAKKQERWCVLGDFNAIREESERKGVSNNIRSEEIAEFDDFITDPELIDLPLHGRRFTWTLCMSRIDRILISESWIRDWPDSKQWSLDKELSDHCPIMLCESEQNWGPKPFRMLNCWKDIDGYHNFVKEQWRELSVEGWGMYVLKEK
jgi:exonuclease III